MGGDGLRFETGIATDVGYRRDINEDAGLVHDEVGVWAVADGMGGHEGGAFASAAVVDALRSVAPAASLADLLVRCGEAIAVANAKIRGHGSAGSVIGTTLVAFLTHKTEYACLWSGDSRLYLVRDGGIRQCTQDHTEVQELLTSGAITAEQALTWPRRNVVTRALGVFEQPALERRDGVLKPNDIVVLCSDGLYNHVADNEILAAVASGAQAAADALVRLTLERGASDNVTVIVIRCVIAREPTVVLPLRTEPFGVTPS